MFGDIEMYETSGSDFEGNEYIKDTEAGRHRHKEVASYNTVRMIPDEGRPPGRYEELYQEPTTA